MTKKCECGAEIIESDKHCPECGKKLKTSWWIYALIIIFLGVFVLVELKGCVNTLQEADSDKGFSEQETETKSIIEKQPEVIDYNSYVKILNHQLKKYEHKNAFVIMGEFENIGDKTISYIDMDAKLYTNNQFQDICFGYAREVNVPPGSTDTYEILCNNVNLPDKYEIRIKDLKFK